MSHKLTIIIPSRQARRQVDFLQNALASIESQTIIDRFDVTVRIGVDAGKVPQIDYHGNLTITFEECGEPGQAAALNTAIRKTSGDYVAFLEDDDRWQSRFLEAAFRVLRNRGAAFVSSTQLTVNERDEIVYISDYPTPSGWFMPQSTLDAVGEFNPEFRWHLDCDWLGRVNQQKISRVHLVECTAPIKDHVLSPSRPQLARVLSRSNGNVELVRHKSPYPLVIRLRHGGSGIARISRSDDRRSESRAEARLLIQRYGQVPW